MNRNKLKAAYLVGQMDAGTDPMDGDAYDRLLADLARRYGMERDEEHDDESENTE